MNSPELYRIRDEDGGDLVFEVAGERGGCVARGEASQEREEKDGGQREKREEEPREKRDRSGDGRKK